MLYTALLLPMLPVLLLRLHPRFPCCPLSRAVVVQRQSPDKAYMHWSRFSLTRLSLFSFNSLNPLQVQLSHAVTESDKAPLGEALCCDVTLVSFLTREGRPWPSTATRDGAAINVAERRQRVAYPELLRPEQRLWLLACEVGGRWSAESLCLVTQLLRLRAQRARAALRPAARQRRLLRCVGLLERGSAKHSCCHAARSSVRCWRLTWRTALAA